MQIFSFVLKKKNSKKLKLNEIGKLINKINFNCRNKEIFFFIVFTMKTNILKIKKTLSILNNYLIHLKIKLHRNRSNLF